MGRNKKLKKGIEGIEKQIELHKEKIESYDGPKETLIPYWRGEIERMKTVKEEKERKLKRKTN